MEIWKDIIGHEAFYKVSNLGNVKSLKYGKNKLLKLVDDGKGYFLVNLYKNKKSKTRKVHQLVAESFLNHTACGYKLVVNHKDFNTRNNNVYNLEIVTNRENSNRKHLKSSSSFTGVSWSKINSKWRSSITINGKAKHLGYFTSELEASATYENYLKTILQTL